MNRVKKLIMGLLVAGIGLVLWGAPVYAHCDTLDGPVVKEAKAALEKGNVTPILKWVQEEKEPEIKKAFNETLTVRKKGKAARDLADRYFFETLVRVHREGEGAPYTGLKETEGHEPAIIEGEKALEAGSVGELSEKLKEALASGLNQRFQHAIEAKKKAKASVKDGRAYVEAYVGFLHYVENLHNALKGAHEGH